jgi:hypothetical protein
MRHNGTGYDAGRRSRDNPSGGREDSYAKLAAFVVANGLVETSRRQKAN